VNRIVFLISFSACSLLVYGKAPDFSMFLYPGTLLKVFLSLTSFFPTWILTISFSSFILLARNFGTILKKNGESGNSCLIPYLRWNY
jgi:hypothetical protein